MAFLIFERVAHDGGAILRPTGESFSLAGYNLLYRAWERRECPTDAGWEVAADELVSLATNGEYSTDTRRLIIDFDPDAKWRIGLIELLHLYAYSYQSTEAGSVDWTPLMLKMRTLLYKEYEQDALSAEEKARCLECIPEPPDTRDFVEFLYLNGNRKGWNWGRSGATNAVFLEGAAREYFRQFF